MRRARFSFRSARGLVNVGGVVAAALLPLGLSACEDVSRFSTGQGEAYCGSIALAGTFREGLSPRVQMRLSLVADALDGPGSPGRLSTFEAEGEGSGEGARLFDEAPLRPIEPLLHDPLSRPEFGDGRIRSAIFAVSPEDPAAESMLAVVSLRSDEAVEVRLLRAGKEGSTDPATRPIFGVFTLSRSASRCGF